MAISPGRDARCPRCGAPLAWDGFATNVQCGYCQTVVPLKAMPAAPPAPVPQGLPGAPRRGPSPLWLVLPGLAVIALGGLATVFALIGSRTQGQLAQGSAITGSLGSGATVPEVTSVDLATTPEQLAKRFGVEVYKNGIHVSLKDAPFASIGFFWDQSHLEHVNSVALTPLSSGVPPVVLERARAQLGRVLRPASTGGHQFGGDGVNLSIGSNVYVGAHGQEDPRWKARMVAMFTLLKGAALGTSDVLDERTKRDVLNIGYPLGRLADVDIAVAVDGAEREVHRVIPGAVSQAERHDVGLGHPWLETAMLVWENAERGKFSRVNLYFTPSFDFKAQREDVVRCLKPLLGEPRVNTTDHLAGQVTLTFHSNQKLPYCHVTNQVVMLHPSKEPDSKATFKKALETLAACG
jgi:hypothetical protein